MLHVLPKSRHHHRTGRMQPLVTGEQRREGIWLLLLWQGSLRSSPASGGEVPAAPPAPCAALGNRFLFFSSCICTSVCVGLLGETPSP